ncbi:hypothetical protein COV15_02840 [Candidatus Woesearchaeota archaeon CG10_big_fil_rev_8_21_14_0_10_34_12]|nr:MAG: hypothetical protein COV15_02840 [Candidatus Woesearchaeota archaeon CG10_big_fil_rev_8_21_14_0_10_34_12]
MEIGIVIFVIAILIAAVWVFFKLKVIQHKFLLLFLIFLIVASFFSFRFAFKGEDISIKNPSDVGKISKLYFSWLTSAFNNFKTLTNQAIKMNWEGNKTT